MNRRITVTIAATAVALAGAPALAAPAPKTACRLIVDDAGDAAVAGQNRPGLDIVSADVASGKKNIVGVLRLGSLAADPLLSAGATYSLSWRLGATPQAFTLVQYSDGSRDMTFDPDASFGKTGDERTVLALVDTANGTITWTLPRKTNPALKPRMSFTGLAAATQASTNLRAQGVSFSGSFLGGDTAETARSYVDASPTCVKGV